MQLGNTRHFLVWELTWLLSAFYNAREPDDEERCQNPACQGLNPHPTAEKSWVTKLDAAVVHPTEGPALEQRHDRNATGCGLPAIVDTQIHERERTLEGINERI